MNKRVQWRAVMLVTMATIAFGLSVRSYAATTPTEAAGPAIERYNPYIDGDRMVFTQVTRRPDDSTTAAIWTRDLVTGRESLVSPIGTGEAMPVTNGSWTAWSEMVSDTHSVVRARANRGGPVIDVFTTAASTFGGGGNDNPDLFLPSVSVSGDRLVTTNGSFVDLTAPELVRFDLPSTRPRYIDVLTTTEGIARTWVSTGKSATVMSDLGPPQLFFVLDNGGRLVSSPFDGCTPGFDAADSQAVIDGNRVAIGVNCGSVPSIATCVLPCATVDLIRLPFGSGATPRVSLSGDVVAYRKSPDFFGGPTSIAVMDLTRDTAPTLVHTTSGAIGPRVSMSGNRIVWDETSFRNGERHADLYVYDRTTRTTTVIDGAGRASVLPAAGPMRLAPDVSGGQIAYNELNADGTESGIWLRSLTGRPQLVSTVATDNSEPQIGKRYVAWNTRNADSGRTQIVAAPRNGRGPTLDVYTTDASAPPTELAGDTRFDLDGDRAIISTVTTDVSVRSHGAVLSGQIGAGTFSTLTPVRDPSSVPFFVDPISEGAARGDGGATVAIGSSSPDAPFVSIYDRDLNRSTVTPSLICSYPTSVSIEGPSVVTLASCFPGSAELGICTLPCTSLPTTLVPSALVPGMSSVFFRHIEQANGTVIVQGGAFVTGGRYRLNRGVQVSILERIDVGAPAAGARFVSIDSGSASLVSMDGDLAVWSVDRFDGIRTGTMFVHDLRRGVTTKL